MMMGGLGLTGLVFIVGAFFVVKYALDRTSHQSQNNSINSAMEILKRRYASGEISKEEYEDRKRDLA